MVPILGTQRRGTTRVEKLIKQPLGGFIVSPALRVYIPRAPRKVTASDLFHCAQITHFSPPSPFDLNLYF